MKIDPSRGAQRPLLPRDRRLQATILARNFACGKIADGYVAELGFPQRKKKEAKKKEKGKACGNCRR